MIIVFMYAIIPCEVISLKISGAIFDMDGTLVDSLMIWDVLWRRFGEKYLNNAAFRPSEADDKAVRTLPLKASMQLIHERYRMGQSGEELLEEANSVTLDFYRNELEMKPGAREFLEHLKQNGVKMCIASATAPDLVAAAFERCGLGRYFSQVFSCGTIGKGKDVPDIFIESQKYLGTLTEETWVFEDSLVAVQTAVSLGMPVVGIFDRFNYGQDEIERLAKEYVAEGEGLDKLIGKPL